MDWDAEVLTKEEQDPSEEKPYASALGFIGFVHFATSNSSQSNTGKPELKDPSMISSGEPPAVTTSIFCDPPKISRPLNWVNIPIVLPTFRARCPNNLFTGLYDETINFHQYINLMESKQQSTSMTAPPNCPKPHSGQSDPSQTPARTWRIFG
ncbi:uncharacterized protein Bfra_005263 [Botrytis fragariae]|uniref:Uncharacterized protein n=1 Tax=Botrytis fragariae TaxID=1964551 RepID=A0A8H6EIT7_9HELO|nr:uncharacterized protein Bfra_005263 [Botrytis fragariae]KAF5873796.1 hypothetical protein Bfra_005263 [Botrytis fragariae]